MLENYFGQIHFFKFSFSQPNREKEVVGFTETENRKKAKIKDLHGAMR